MGTFLFLMNDEVPHYSFCTCTCAGDGAVIFNGSAYVENSCFDFCRGTNLQIILQPGGPNYAYQIPPLPP